MGDKMRCQAAPSQVADASKNSRGCSGQEGSFGPGPVGGRHSGAGMTSQAEEGSLGKEQSGPVVGLHSGYQDHSHTPLYSRNGLESWV